MIQLLESVVIPKVGAYDPGDHGPLDSATCRIENGQMPWLTDSQLMVLSRVLDPSPERNRKHLIDVRWICFYASELKGAGQLVSALQIEAAGKGVADGTGDRYRNHLKNLGLLSVSGSVTPSGNDVLAWASANAKLLEDPKQAAEGVDRIVYKNLLDSLAREPTSRSAKYFRNLLSNLRTFVGAIPAAEYAAIADDLERLRVLQLIHSAGNEIARLWWLPAAEQKVFLDTWEAVARTWTADYKPANRVEATIYDYLRLREKIQKDVRFRVRAFFKAWLDLQNDLPKESGTVDVAEEEDAGATLQTFSLSSTTEVPLDQPRQLLLSGCPGSGKSHVLAMSAREAESVHKIIRTTFHAETSYFDFVGSFRPAPVYLPDGATLLEASGKPSQAVGRPIIDYRFVPGPMARSHLYAVLNPTWKVVLIIEEINRANASAVFGDILQLLERDADSGQSRYSIEPHPAFRDFLGQHKALDAGGTMRLPGNLYLWATMNNADQGVQALDSAFRRRWSFRYMGHQTVSAIPSQVRYAGKPVDWDAFRSAINGRLLEAGTHEDKLIGP